MLNDPMDRAPGTKPVLPESLHQAVREAEAIGRAAEERAQLAMPFRARLRARDAVRPQPTLSILTQSGPVSAGPVTPLAISEVRTLRKPPAPHPPAKTPVAASAGAVAVIPKGSQTGGGGDGDDDMAEDRGGLFRRMGNFSQFAFAGLAVLGLAGLSVMAAENALGNKADTDDTDPDLTRTTASAGSSNVSVAAVSQASLPVEAAATPWFDYRGTADMLKARVAEIRAQEQAAARLETAEAERTAAAAIANAEAARVAAEAPPNPPGPAIIDNRLRDRLAAEEAARAAAATAAMQLQSEKAAAAARVEAGRIAAEEAARASAAAAERQRIAEAQAARAAEAEAARLADLAAKKKAAEAEARRLADAEAAKAAQVAEAKRLADIETKRAAQAEATRIAALEAKRASDAANARRLADAEARRLADVEAGRLAQVAALSAAPAAAPAPRVWRDPPGRASLKPARPAPPVVLAVAVPAGTGLGPVVRGAPQTLTPAAPEVRAMAGLPRPVDDFIAERTEYTAGRALDVAALDALKSDFLRLVETSADGAHHQLTTPDGRPLLIHFERTVSIDPMKASFNAISYSSQPDNLVTRAYLQPVDMNVKVMCRDVSYAFPGQERGRFAACEGANGTWTMARASATLGTPI